MYVSIARYFEGRGDSRGKRMYLKARERVISQDAKVGDRGPNLEDVLGSFMEVVGEELDELERKATGQ